MTQKPLLHKILAQCFVVCFVTCFSFSASAIALQGETSAVSTSSSMTASIAVSDCKIAAGKGTCAANYNITVTNAVGSNHAWLWVGDGASAKGQGAFNASYKATQLSAAIPYGSTTFYLRKSDVTDGALYDSTKTAPILDQKSATATCNSGSTYDSQAKLCVAPTDTNVSTASPSECASLISHGGCAGINEQNYVCFQNSNGNFELHPVRATQFGMGTGSASLAAVDGTAVSVDYNQPTTQQNITSNAKAYRGSDHQPFTGTVFNSAFGNYIIFQNGSMAGGYKPEDICASYSMPSTQGGADVSSPNALYTSPYSDRPVDLTQIDINTTSMQTSDVTNTVMSSDSPDQNKIDIQVNANEQALAQSNAIYIQGLSDCGKKSTVEAMKSCTQELFNNPNASSIVTTTQTTSQAQTDAEALATSSGNERMGMIANTISAVENPQAAQTIGSTGDAQSASMYATLEALTASEFAANEAVSSRNQFGISAKCTELQSGQFKDDIPIYTASCSIENIINRLTAFFQESDSLSQQIIELETTKNQAVAENIKRDQEIATEKQAMQDVSAKLSDNLDALKKAKDAQVAASKKVATAAVALTVAQATPCVTVSSTDAKGNTSNSQDCSARDQAVTNATSALNSEKASLAKTVETLKVAVTAVLDLLINKMGVETKAVLALLAGTIQGETGKENVHFTVLGTDFPLIDLGKTIRDYAGVNAKTASSFIDPTGLEKSTVNYFGDIVNNYANSISINKGSVSSTSLSTKASGEVLSQIAKTSGGVDDLSTISFAIKAYKKDTSNKLLNYLDSMKTPQSRISTMDSDIASKNALIQNLGLMIGHNIDFMDENLKIFQSLYKEKEQSNNSVVGLLFPYLHNKFSSAPFRQKLAEGYSSKIDIDAIRLEYKSLAADVATPILATAGA